MKRYDLSTELLTPPIPRSLVRTNSTLLGETGMIATPDNAYRYALWKTWGFEKLAAFVMLNPSRADEQQPDPTFTKVCGLARRWASGGVIVVNLFALRATDPSELSKARDPVGPHNAEIVRRVLDSPRVGLTVLAWGNEGQLDARDEAFLVVHAEREFYCLCPAGKEALTKRGSPRHPVRLGYDVVLKPVCWDGALSLKETA